MAVVYRCVEILTVGVVFFRSPGVFHSQDSFPSTFRPRLWETSSGVVATENPRMFHQQPPHSERVTVWCGIACFGVIDPYFFDENGEAASVTSKRYIEMIRGVLVPELWRKAIDINSVWFQQDGARPHTARATINKLDTVFSEYVVSQNGNVQ